MTGADVYPFQDAELTIADRVADLMRRLTPEEKAAQLLHQAPAIERLSVPAYNWWNECLHGVARAGVATVFPQAISLAAMWNLPLLRQVASVIADEARAKHHEFERQGDRDLYRGLTFWAPNVNIFRDPRWGRGHETYGECPFLSARYGVAFCQELQGNDPHYLKLVATPKHFAVHSGPESQRHHFDAVVSDQDLHETYLPAFHACVVEGGAQSVMTAYNRLNGEPCSSNTTLMQHILREEWGFQGYVVSDCWAVRDLHEHHDVTRTPQESAARALRAGCDLNCGCSYEHLPAALREGLLQESDLDRALERLLTARMQLGMFDPPEIVPHAHIPYEVNASPEHRTVARQAARESLVLLKNNGILPLQTTLRSVAVIGPNAASDDVLMANYAGTSSITTTPLEGIRAALDDCARVLYTEGCRRSGTAVEGLDRAENITEALSLARRADAVVMCLGLSAEIEGEQGDDGNSEAGGDKTNLDFPGLQHQLLQQVVALGRPTVLVVIAGSPMDLSWAHEHVDAIVFAGYGGQEAGGAIADVLFGKSSPAGRLPMTFPRSLDDVPPFEDYQMTGRTYRFAQAAALYPFGYGLSYSRFEYSDLVLSSTETDARTNIEVRARVRNVGAAASDEVVQLYVRDDDASCRTPHWNLRGFQRIHLAQGAETEVSFTLTPESFALTTTSGQRVVEAGSFTVYLAGQQPDARSTELTGQAPLAAQLRITETRELRLARVGA